MTERNWKPNPGHCPVPPEEMVWVKLRDTGEIEGVAEYFLWALDEITHWDYWDYEQPLPVEDATPETDRAAILDTAKEYITKDRAQTHGEDAENSFGVIADFWSAYLGMDIDAEDVCALMTLLKLARIKNNPTHLDSWIDAAGYSALGGEIATAKPSRG